MLSYLFHLHHCWLLTIQYNRCVSVLISIFFQNNTWQQATLEDSGPSNYLVCFSKKKKIKRKEKPKTQENVWYEMEKQWKEEMKEWEKKHSCKMAMFRKYLKYFKKYKSLLSWKWHSLFCFVHENIKNGNNIAVNYIVMLKKNV